MNHSALGHSDPAHAASGRQLAQRCRMVPAPEQATLADLIDAMNTRSEGPPSADHQLRLPLWQLRPEAVLFHEGSAAESIYIVRTGNLKCVRVLEDGYHQVLSFAGRGDVLGFESFYRGLQLTSAKALDSATVFAIPAHGLDGLRERSPAFDAALQFALSRQLARAGDMAELLAAVAADTKLARFLVWLSARMVESGQSGLRLHLRMGRRDIASLLGVANETISRSFTRLAESGVLEVVDRDVRIIDLDALKERTRCTRGWATG
jgi:CRP/FNR family transcriptional regulator